jgi:nitroimidazol reductase NimA-like FMN-containing flavoprotein (pyridoxamine 5'-phosphate oxidase superfamily)
MGSASETKPPGHPGRVRSSRLIDLSRSECLELLAATEFGRVVLSTASAASPLIRPVNYRFDEPTNSVIFRTGEGSKFHALARSARALFEIDAIDPQARTGWSVIVSGRTEQVTAPAEIRRLEQLGLSPWAQGHHLHWIRIRARTVSGRRIVPEASDQEGSHRDREGAEQ